MAYLPGSRPELEFELDDLRNYNELHAHAKTAWIIVSPHTGMMVDTVRGLRTEAITAWVGDRLPPKTRTRIWRKYRKGGYEVASISIVPGAYALGCILDLKKRKRAP